MQCETAVGDSGGYRRAIFRGATRFSELHIDLADWHTPLMHSLDRIRQFKQLALGGLGPRERLTFTALSLAYIARYDFGLSREEIRTPAVAAAVVIAMLMAVEFFGKRLRKPK
jgi:hypothetical protein